MAVTNTEGGASLLAGIPDLTRTYGPGEKEPTFAELLAACTSSAVHLEIHDVHITSDPAYQAWLAGKADEQASIQQYRRYSDVVASAARRGVMTYAWVALRRCARASYTAVTVTASDGFTSKVTTSMYLPGRYL